MKKLSVATSMVVACMLAGTASAQNFNERLYAHLDAVDEVCESTIGGGARICREIDDLEDVYEDGNRAMQCDFVDQTLSRCIGNLGDGELVCDALSDLADDTCGRRGTSGFHDEMWWDELHDLYDDPGDEWDYDPVRDDWHRH